MQLSALLIWENLGLVVAISAITSVATLPSVTLLAFGLGMHPIPRILTLLAAFLAWNLLVPPMQFSAVNIGQRAIEGEERGVVIFLKGCLGKYWQRVWIGMIRSGVYVIVLANVMFYANISRTAGLVIGVVAFYIVLLWQVIGIYSYSLRSAQFRNASIFAVTSVLYTFGIILTLAIIFVILSATGAGFLLLAPGIWAMVSARATHTQLRRFDLIEHDHFDPE